MPEGASAVINAWLIRVALPALILAQVPGLSWAPELFYAALTPWIAAVGAALFIPLMARPYGLSRSSVGALVMTCGFGNTAFIGLPMAQALVGPQATGPALIADQLGSFLAISTVGIVAASLYAGKAVTPRDLALRLMKFPPFAALILAIIVRFTGGWHPDFEAVLNRLGDTLTPLALFSVGLAFRLREIRGRGRALAIGLSWKLLLAPLVCVLVAMSAGMTGMVVNVGVLQAAQGPMITAGILAQDLGLDSELVTLVVGIGILLSFFVAPLWFFLVA